MRSFWLELVIHRNERPYEIKSQYCYTKELCRDYKKIQNELGAK